MCYRTSTFTLSLGVIFFYIQTNSAATNRSNKHHFSGIVIVKLEPPQ